MDKSVISKWSFCILSGLSWCRGRRSDHAYHLHARPLRELAIMLWLVIKGAKPPAEVTGFVSGWLGCSTGV